MRQPFIAWVRSLKGSRAPDWLRFSPARDERFRLSRATRCRCAPLSSGQSPGFPP